MASLGPRERRSGKAPAGALSHAAGRNEGRENATAKATGPGAAARGRPVRAEVTTLPKCPLFNRERRIYFRNKLLGVLFHKAKYAGKGLHVLVPSFSGYRSFWKHRQNWLSASAGPGVSVEHVWRHPGGLACTCNTLTFRLM